MSLKGLSYLFDGRVFKVFNNYYRMGITHRDSTKFDLQIDAVNGQRAMIPGESSVCAKRQTSGFQHRLFHIDGNFAGLFETQRKNPVVGFDCQRVFLAESFGPYKQGKASGAVSAVLYLTAIDIKNPVVEIHIWLARRLNQQELIITDAQMPVREGLDLPG